LQVTLFASFHCINTVSCCSFQLLIIVKEHLLAVWLMVCHFHIFQRADLARDGFTWSFAAKLFFCVCMCFRPKLPGQE